jgi:hypothetical protein
MLETCGFGVVLYPKLWAAKWQVQSSEHRQDCLCHFQAGLPVPLLGRLCFSLVV